MRTETSILVFGVIVIGVVLLIAHPNSRPALRGLLQRGRAFWPAQACFTGRRCWAGVAVTACAFTALNLVPHLLTRHEPEHDGLQVMGFPFTFRSFGGYAASVWFHTPTLLLDALVGVVAAVVVGYAVARLRWGHSQL